MRTIAPSARASGVWFDPGRFSAEPWLVHIKVKVGRLLAYGTSTGGLRGQPEGLRALHLDFQVEQGSVIRIVLLAPAADPMLQDEWMLAQASAFGCEWGNDLTNPPSAMSEPKTVTHDGRAIPFYVRGQVVWVDLSPKCRCAFLVSGEVRRVDLETNTDPMEIMDTH